MLILPSIGLGWLHPIGRRHRPYGGGPYVGAGIGLGFPFITAEDRHGRGMRQAAGRHRPRLRPWPRTGLGQKRKPSFWWGKNRDRPEILAAQIMASPALLLGLLGHRGYRAGRATVGAGVMAAGGALRGLGHVGRRIGRAGKWYGHYVRNRGHHKPFTSDVNRNHPRLFSGDRRPVAALEEPGVSQSPRPSFGHFRPTITPRPVQEGGLALSAPSAGRPSAGMM